MAMGMIVLFVVALLLVGLIALGVMGVVMMFRGRIAGLALLLVSAAGGLVMLLGAGWLFMVNRPSDEMPTATRSITVSASRHDGSQEQIELSTVPRTTEDPLPVASLEPTPPTELAEVVIPPGRPEWVEAPPKEEDDTLYVAVNSGPYETGRASRNALDAELVAATEDYIDEVLNRSDATQFISYTPREIREHLVADEYSEVIEVSFGPMHQAHARLKFGSDFIAQVKERWRQVVIASRLAGAGLFFVGAVAILGALYLFLRLDTASRGYYTGRLQVAASVVILGIIAAGVLVAQWIPWL